VSLLALQDLGCHYQNFVATGISQSMGFGQMLLTVPIGLPRREDEVFDYVPVWVEGVSAGTPHDNRQIRPPVEMRRTCLYRWNSVLPDSDEVVPQHQSGPEVLVRFHRRFRFPQSPGRSQTEV